MERDVKDKVHVHSCSTEVQSNPEEEEMGLPSRCPRATMEYPLSPQTGLCCQLALGGQWESPLLAL